MNQITETLHATLDGYYFNKLIAFEKKEYENLEDLI